MNDDWTHHAFLTVTAMAEGGWETAVDLPLPPSPDLELLYLARGQVIAYLQCYLNDAALVAPLDEVRRDITRAAARLIEICEAIRSAPEG